jgi:hypothetical protein
MGPTASLDALNKKPSLLLKRTEQRPFVRPRRSLVAIPNPHVTKLDTFSVTERRRHKILKYLHQLCETVVVPRNNGG